MGDTLKQLDEVYSKWERRSNLSASELKQKNQGYEEMIESGRQAWRNKFTETAPTPPDRQLRQKRRERWDHRLPVHLHSTADRIGFYKTAPLVQPKNSAAKRPYMGRCPTCLPQSRSQFYDGNVKEQGLQDILRLETSQMDQPWLTRQFSHIACAMRWNVCHKYPDVSVAVLTSPRLAEAIRSSIASEVNAAMASSDRRPDERQLKREKYFRTYSESLVKRMAACISNRLVRATGWFLHHFLGRLLTGILVHKGQIGILKKAKKKNVPMIFLPTHRSHMDYILITFILLNFDIKAPHVAAGDNLLIPLFSWLMRGLGGYFIRRRLDNGHDKKDLVYRAVLYQYMDELLQKGESFEFFLEGGRTRSGKALYPKGGLLSVVVDAFKEGRIEDVCLVPVGISYEKIVDGTFIGEQMGGEKQSETFCRAVKAIWRVYQNGFGKVRVDFGQPFSLKEYLELNDASLDELYESQWTQNVPALAPRIGGFSPLCSTNSLTGDYRYKIQGLAELVIFNCQNWQAVMSTQLLAFLLLTRHRGGVKTKLLAVTMEWLKNEVQMRGRDVGFSGEMEHVICHAVQLLGSHLVISSDAEGTDDGERVLTPATDLPNVFELSYYANSVACTFALESVLAFAVVSETKQEDWLNFGHQEEVFVSRSQIFQRASDLCHLLQYEFVFKLPNTNWEEALVGALENLFSWEILALEEDLNPEEKQFTSRVSRTLAWAGGSDDSEDDDLPDATRYQVKTDSTYSMDKLQFLLSVLAPILECYYVVACHIEMLVNNPMTEGAFMKMVHGVTKDRVKSGAAVYSESASYDSVRNAVQSFQQICVIDKVEGITTNNKRPLILQDDEATKDRLNMLLEVLESCVAIPSPCRFAGSG